MANYMQKMINSGWREKRRKEVLLGGENGKVDGKDEKFQMERKNKKRGLIRG